MVIRSFLKPFLLFFLVLVGFSSCKRESVPLLETVSQDVIGGKVDLRYPAVGALIENNFAFCTGTLISSRVVLTAGHCIDSKSKKNLSFRIDLPSSSSPKGFTSYLFSIDSRYIAPHPKWTGKVSGSYDIAIVVLKNPVDPKIAKPIPYNAMPLDQSWIGKKALFLGFGLIQSVPKAISPATKHGAMIPIVQMKSKLFLTYDPKVSTCHGDSGGPALVNIAGRFSVIGVNSYTASAVIPGSTPPRTRCDGRNGVTRVDAYAPFVQSWLDRFGDAPGLCKTSLDCTHCEECSSLAGKQVCVRKASLKQTTFCRPCRNDQMCGGGVCYRFQTLSRCLHRCPANGCCGAGATCQLWTVNAKRDWYCIPDKKKCPDVTCQSDQDCGKGEVCKGAICVANRPPRSAKLCLPCSKHSDCSVSNGVQALCFGAEGVRFCSQPCSKAGFCPDGFSCQQPHQGMPKQCLPTKGTCSVPCQKEADCLTGFACLNGFCSRKGGGIAGDFCDPMPCQKGFSCVATLSGKRCLQACGVPVGEAGSPCLSGNKCNGKAKCNLISAKIKVCMQPCTSDFQCHGGVCLNRVCSCRQDSDCASDAFCNQTTGFFSTCLPKKTRRPCQKGQQCKPIGTQTFCVPKQGGFVGLGQRCDSFQQCRKGLVCVQGKDGLRCLEDCSKTRICTLGGICSAERNGIAVCVCSKGDCPSGRTCSASFYLGSYGYCVASSTSPSCYRSLECPPAYKCDAGKCVLAPPPEFVEEPASEPRLEPMPEPVMEPMSEPEPVIDEPQTPEEPSRVSEEPLSAPEDAGNTEEKKEKEQVLEHKLEANGCQCGSIPSVPTFSFSLLLLFFFGLRLMHSKKKKRRQ